MSQYTLVRMQEFHNKIYWDLLTSVSENQELDNIGILDMDKKVNIWHH